MGADVRCVDEFPDGELARVDRFFYHAVNTRRFGSCFVALHFRFVIVG